MSWKTSVRHAIAALVAVVLLSGPAVAQVSDGYRALESARQAYADSRFFDAITILEDLVVRAQLPPDDLFQARELLARSYVKDGRPLKGRDIFLAMLRTNPGYRPSEIGVPPDERAIFDDALRIYRQEAGGTTPDTVAHVVARPGSSAPKRERVPVQSRTSFFEVRAGIGSSALRGKGIDVLKDEAEAIPVPFDNSWRGGFTIAAEFGRAFGSVVMQSGLAWVREAGNVATGSGAAREEQGVRLDEIEIPILLRERIYREVFVVAGPALALRMGSRGTSEGVAGSSSGNLDDFTRPFGLRVLAGVGTPVWTMGAGSIAVHARYRIGLFDVFEKSSDVRASFQGFEGSLGYMW